MLSLERIPFLGSKQGVVRQSLPDDEQALRAISEDLYAHYWYIQYLHRF